MPRDPVKEKACQARYDASPKGKASKARRNARHYAAHRDEVKARVTTYSQTPEGKAVGVRAREKYLATEHGALQNVLRQIKSNAQRRGNR